MSVRWNLRAPRLVLPRPCGAASLIVAVLVLAVPGRAARRAEPDALDALAPTPPRRAAGTARAAGRAGAAGPRAAQSRRPEDTRRLPLPPVPPAGPAARRPQSATAGRQRPARCRAAAPARRRRCWRRSCRPGRRTPRRCRRRPTSPTARPARHPIPGGLRSPSAPTAPASTRPPLAALREIARRRRTSTRHAVHGRPMRRASPTTPRPRGGCRCRAGSRRAA